jgi:uncharacterized protein YegP (UPF0339 family)
MAAKFARFDVYKDRKGEWRWRLLARNGRIVADSGEGFVSRAHAYRSARAVRTAADGASIGALR